MATRARGRHRAPRRGNQSPGQRRKSIAAGVLAGTIALPIILGAGGADAAVFVIHPDRADQPGPAPVPVAAVPLPAAVEELAPYLPQVSCDPHAKPGVQAFADYVLATWQRGHSGGIVRACDRDKGAVSEHKEGRAWDWMLNADSYADVTAGQRVIDWLLADDAANARRLGIMYFIWNERIWSAHRLEDGWQPYHGENDHTDHIHFSFDWAGAEKRTSWWTGKVAPMEYGPCRKYIGDPVPAYGDTVNLKPCPKAILKPKPVEPPVSPTPSAAPTTPTTPTPEPADDTTVTAPTATPTPAAPTSAPEPTTTPSPVPTAASATRSLPKGEPMPAASAAVPAPVPGPAQEPKSRRTTRQGR